MWPWIIWYFPLPDGATLRNWYGEFHEFFLGHSTICTRDMDGQMPRKKQASNRRTNCSRIWLALKESNTPITTERKGTPGEWTEDNQWKTGRKLDNTNQQLKKWLLRRKPVIDHSMKRVQELAKENSKPIWQLFTKNKPAEIKVSRKIQKRKHARMKVMLNNPLTNVYTHLKQNRSTSQPLPAKKRERQED